MRRLLAIVGVVITLGAGTAAIAAADSTPADASIRDLVQGTSPRPAAGLLRVRRQLGVTTATSGCAAAVRSVLLQDGEDVASGIGEPGDRWAVGSRWMPRSSWRRWYRQAAVKHRTLVAANLFAFNALFSFIFLGTLLMQQVWGTHRPRRGSPGSLHRALTSAGSAIAVEAVTAGVVFRRRTGAAVVDMSVTDTPSEGVLVPVSAAAKE